MADLSGQSRPIRFALQVNPAAEEIDEIGARAEAAGFDVITVADHIGPTLGAPMITLASLAAATESIRLGTMVINNDMRNPVQLAWEAATLHRLSGGRFELGLGAGHSPHEYAETGISLDPAATRKERLREAVEIISGLLKGETVDYDGNHYKTRGAHIGALETPLPILVGGNGMALLTHAAKHADIIGLQGLGRTLEDGHRHTVKFSIEHLESQLATIDQAAPERQPELGALVQVCTITDDRRSALEEVVENIEGLTMEAADATPYFAVGTVEQMADHLIAARDRWGISYFTVRSLEMAPVIELVRSREG